MTQIEVGVDLLVGVQMLSGQWHCSFMNTDVLCNTSLLVLLSRICDLYFDPSTLDKTEVGESLICCCLFHPQTPHEFLFWFRFYPKLKCSKKHRGEQGMRYYIY